MTAPDDLIRRDTAEAAIRARQSITQDPMIYAGLSVALQELAALPADPVAEAAGKLADHEVRDGPWKLISGKVLCRYCYAPSDGDGHAPECLWETYRAAVAARAKETR